MPNEPAALSVGEWSGTLAELVAAAESGAIAASAISLSAVITVVRGQGGELEGDCAAYALLGRLVELKARAFLPTPPSEPAPDVEPDAEEEAARLAERLAAYQVFAEAASALREFAQRRAERFGRPEGSPRPPRGDRPAAPGLPAGGEALERLLTVFGEVWERAQPRTREVQRERFTVAQAVERLRLRLQGDRALVFEGLFDLGADRLEVVVTFLALLELVRLGEAAVVQDAPFAPVRIAWVERRRGNR